MICYHLKYHFSKYNFKIGEYSFVELVINCLVRPCCWNCLDWTRSVMYLAHPTARSHAVAFWMHSGVFWHHKKGTLSFSSIHTWNEWWSVVVFSHNSLEAMLLKVRPSCNFPSLNLFVQWSKKTLKKEIFFSYRFEKCFRGERENVKLIKI